MPKQGINVQYGSEGDVALRGSPVYGQDEQEAEITTLQAQIAALQELTPIFVGKFIRTAVMNEWTTAQAQGGNLQSVAEFVKNITFTIKLDTPLGFANANLPGHVTVGLNGGNPILNTFVLSDTDVSVGDQAIAAMALEDNAGGAIALEADDEVSITFYNAS